MGRNDNTGMLWGKQLCNYDVGAGSMATELSRLRRLGMRGGRNARWRNFDSIDVMSMPDQWQYPWSAAWELPPLCDPRAR